MAQQYAKDQPAGFTNRIERVAIVGASGNVGKPITEALLATGKHAVTALTRIGSAGSLPEGVKIAEIDYDNEETIINALKGQQYLIITMSVMAPPDNHHKLVTAAAKAGVPYVMPNLWGRVFLDDEELNASTLVGPGYAAGIRDIEAQGVSKWTGVSCSFWYEWSLTGGPHHFGFDIPAKKATFYNKGHTKISTTTHPQCGRAIAALLSLPNRPHDASSSSPTLSRWFNDQLIISSFFISQREMLDSIQRVTGSSDAEWTITYADPAKTHSEGLKILAAGGPDARLGFGQALYSRIFMDDATWRTDEGAANGELGLPEEDLDEITRKALESVAELKEKLEGYGK